MISLRKTLLLFALTATSLFWGCANDKSSKGGANTPDDYATDLGYKPSQRWPEKASFSYNYRSTHNGSRCETGEQTFSTKAAYCLGLQDQSLNHACALNSRKIDYRSNCGDDFQEINVSGSYGISGFDQRLQKQCATGPSPSNVFRTTRKFCEFLKDETLHQSCFWDDRREKYEDLGCQDPFSPEPEKVHPTPPPPSTEPSRTPTPLPTLVPEKPFDNIEIVHELRAEGIEVEIDTQAIYEHDRFHRPGEPTAREILAQFWLELAANKQTILSRKSSITQINVTIYAHYLTYGDSKILSLDFETPRTQLINYFPLFDQLLRDSEEYGINFDFIQSSSDRKEFFFQPLKNVLDGLAENHDDLVTIKGMIKTLNLDSYSAYFESSRELKLQRETFREDFRQYIQWLKPLAPVYQWADKNHVEIDADYDLEKNFPQVKPAFALLKENLASLQSIAQNGQLKELRIYFLNGEHQYWASLGLLTLSIGDWNSSEFTQLLSALSRLSQRAKEIGAEFEINNDKLDKDFLHSTQFTEKLWTTIKKKSGKIKKLTMGSQSKFYEYSQELVIGCESSELETEKIISAIK